MPKFELFHWSFLHNKIITAHGQLEMVSDLLLLLLIDFHDFDHNKRFIDDFATFCCSAMRFDHGNEFYIWQ